jgi:thiol:disulfide interchange protein DsbD
MVPIVAGMLTRAGTNVSPARGFALASIYTLAMASAYALLGVAAAWSGQNLQGALQTPAALITMAAIYLALGLSSFGLFGLQVPARFADRLAGRLHGGAGPLIGAAALGFSSALIVGPCVTPPLAAALLYVAQTGDTLRGAATLFALGLGMGFPLILVGTFGAGILPRSGPWLVTVRKLFGFAFVGLAILLLGRLLPAMLTLLLWAGLAVGLAAFLGAFDRVSRLSAPAVRFGKAFGLALFVYGAALILGAAGGSDDPLRPLGVFGVHASPAGALDAQTVTSMAALDAAIAGGQPRGKPIMIDFTAE